jgi:hypothetical protein
MSIGFGKHADKSVALVVLRHPDYTMWVLANRCATGPLAVVRQRMIHLIHAFDERPILCNCSAPKCSNVATRGSVYRGRPFPRWLCEACDEFQFGASRGKLAIVRSYSDAVNYVNACCGGDKDCLKILIRTLAEAKGAPARIGERQAAAFFA